MNPKDFAKKRKAHIEALAQIKTDWEDWLDYLAHRFAKKFGRNCYVSWGNQQYKVIEDENTGKLTIGVRVIGDTGFYPVYDENSHERWKYETLSEYQDVTARYLKYLYDVIILPPLLGGFHTCHTKEDGRLIVTYHPDIEYRHEIDEEKRAKGENVYPYYESLKDY